MQSEFNTEHFKSQAWEDVERFLQVYETCLSRLDEADGQGFDDAKQNGVLKIGSPKLVKL